MKKKEKVQLQKDWDDLTKKWNSVTPFVRKGVDRVLFKEKKSDNSHRSSACKIKSFSTHPTRDDTALAPAKVYTGGKILGIATMHKSNAVPVFSSEQAVDIASMRR